MSAKHELAYIIGGSASTGSSLLAHCMGKHSQIFCGPETNLLTQGEWMTSWKETHSQFNPHNFQLNLPKMWHLHRGVQIDHLLLEAEFSDLFRSELDFQSFLMSCFESKMSSARKDILAEKTPSNAAFFAIHEVLFPEAIKVLTVRNPRDAIASMVRRGWSVPYSAGLYLFNIALGLNQSNVHVVRYEKLRDDLGGVLRKILELRGLKYEVSMMDTDDMQELDSWYQLNGNDSISTFALLDRRRQDEVDYFITKLRIKNDFSFYGCWPRCRSIIELTTQLNYPLELRQKIGRSAIARACFLFEKEKIKRRIKNFPLSGNEFPFNLMK